MKKSTEKKQTVTKKQEIEAPKKMKSCAEKKQTTIKKILEFSTCSIEFEIRGASKFEFEHHATKVLNISNNPRLFELKALAAKARDTGNWSDITSEEMDEYISLTDDFEIKAKELRFELLKTCLNPSKLYNAGFNVIDNKIEFEDVNELLSTMLLPDIDKLVDIVVKLSTIGTDEVAAEEVK